MVEEELVRASDDDSSDDEEDLEEDEGKNLDDLELPFADDLELAWENLDVARLILSTKTSVDHTLQLADVHIALGDVSLESGNGTSLTRRKL